MRQRITLIALVMSFLFFVSCSAPSENKKTEETPKDTLVEKKIEKKDCTHAHWSHHKGEEGPENWKNLCDGFAPCGGEAQSPIDITTQEVITDKELPAINFNYAKSKVNIINNGHTVQFNIEGEHKINVEGKDYKLLQFHYHALSEHTIDGKHFPLEVHFVHKHSDKDYAVLGVMFAEGKENKLFKKYLAQFPKTKGEYKAEDVIDILNLFPENKSFYHYDGSLTTPPCSEIVNWFVFQNPVEASKEQITEFSEILNNNYRPVLPVNGRKITSYNQ